ncbi:MAG TPA: hypothetical protein VFG35_20855 [Actinoplanes sp.]|nr:hypothetical protein [Actinoplanes sp.]
MSSGSVSWRRIVRVLPRAVPTKPITKGDQDAQAGEGPRALLAAEDEGSE